MKIQKNGYRKLLQSLLLLLFLLLPSILFGQESYQSLLEQVQQLPASQKENEEWKSLAIGLIQDLIDLEMRSINQKTINENQKTSLSEVRTEYATFSASANLAISELETQRTVGFIISVAGVGYFVFDLIRGH